MSLLFGISSSDIIPQSDFQANQNENGGWTASQSFLIKKSGLDNTTILNQFAGGTILTALDENADDYFRFLKLSHIPSITTIEGGYTLITVEFTGFSSATFDFTDEDNADLSPTYSLRGAVMDVPLAEHRKFKALSEAFRVTLGRIMDGSVIYKEFGIGGSGLYWNSEFGSYLPATEQITSASGDAYEFAVRIQQGRSSYRVGTYEWTKRWESTAPLSAAALSKLGKIAVPPGSPPEPTGNRDWMLISANQEQSGSGDFKFQKELVFLLSDAGGHDSFLQDD